MEIIRGLERIPNLSLALGFFDGVHRGHVAVINSAIALAELYNTRSAVVTFDRHPYSYLQQIPEKYIMTFEDKYKEIEKIGIDYLIELDFSTVSNMSPDVYLKKILVDYYTPKAISTGYNHHFGVGGTGGVAFLANMQRKYDYSYTATPPQTIFEEVISSSSIRSYVGSGSFPVANSMLGRSFFVKGKVIEGKGFGKTLGYPTANIRYPENIITPPFGVYECDVTVDGTIYRGVTNYGVCPTVTITDTPSLETHIFNFEGDLYGKEIKVEFMRKIRDEMQFNTVDELKRQIEIDIQFFKS